MKKTKTLYWIFTGLFCFLMAGSAIPDVLSAPEAVKGMHGGLGYPLYFIPFIGTAKLLGVLALLLPVYHRIKEWAYAGLFFDLMGATVSLVAAGQGANAPFMVLPLGFAVLSYVFFRRKQTQAALHTKSQALRLATSHGHAAMA